MKTSENGISLIKNFEGLRLKAYQCTSSVWTIGWGNTIINGIKVKNGDLIDEEMAENLLREDIRRHEDIVTSRIKIPINQNQFDALVSHTYNTGGSDTLFELINSDAGIKKIHNWFIKTYITSAGILIPGLVKRRKIEAEIYFLKQKEESINVLKKTRFN